MKLSVCLIARNEESRLAAAIESVREVADEVVVTDTGSTDGTVELARSLGARVKHFAWIDDFAAARNACLDEARGEWILWLDGDERLKAGSGGEVRRAIASTAVVAYQVIREDFFSHERTDWFSEMYQLRLVRRDLPCRFVGRIHEHLMPDPAEAARQLGKSVAASKVRLQHWGYTSERMPEKTDRAIHLSELELRDRPGQLYYLVELARSLLERGQARGVDVLNEAVDVMMVDRANAVPPSAMAASLIEQLLSMPAQRLVDVDELLELGARWFPRNAPVLWALARTRSLRGDWAGAEKDLRRLIELLGSSGHDRFMSFDPRITEDARFNLGVCMVRQTRIDEARVIFQKLLASPRRGEDARKNLEAIAAVKAQAGGAGGA